VAKQWRINLAKLDALLDQLADEWALLVETAGRITALRMPADHVARPDVSAPLSAEGQPEPPDLIEQALWRQAQQAATWRAPADFTLRVRMRLPADAPPLDVVTTGPYGQFREHARLVFGALSVSALLTFGSSWLIAIVEPSLAFAILAALVSLVLLLAQSLRFVLETAAGAASNPVLLLVAMSAPVVAFLVVATQLPRWSERLGGLREA